MKNLEVKIEKHFISLAIIIGLIIVFIMPPLQMPDEDSHFKNIYSISNFNVIPIEQNGSAGRYYPEGILKFEADSRRMIGNLDEKYTFKELYFNDALYDQLPLKDQEKIFNSHSAVTASPVMYLPQVIGVWIYKLLYSIPIFGTINMMKPVHYMYAARIGNLIGFIMMGYFILKWIPTYKKVTFAILLMPMTISLAASLSYDVMVIGITLMFCAWMLKNIYSDKQMSLKEYILTVLFACILIQVKYVYFPVLFLYILDAYKKSGSKKELIVKSGILIVVPILMLALVQFIVSINLGGVIDSTDFKTEQVKFILSNPIKYMGILINTFVTMGRFYMESFVGKFGSLDTNLPHILIVTYMMYLIILCLFDGAKEVKITKLHKAMYVIITVAIIILIETGLYVMWTSIPEIGGVGHEIVSGVQGRYFIPCSVLGMLLLHNNIMRYKLKNVSKVIENHFLDVQKFFCIFSCIVIGLRFWV